MGRIYRFMGMKVGLLQNGMKLSLKNTYEADVTTGTIRVWRDYLRRGKHGHQAPARVSAYHYAIVGRPTPFS